MSVRWREDTGKREVRYREGGRHRSKSFTNEKDARSFDAKVSRARELGEPLHLDRGRETLAEFFEEWWRDYALRRHARKTRENNKGVWLRHVRPSLGGYRLRELTPALIDRFQTDRLAAGVGDETVRKALALVQGVLTFAVLRDKIASNPAQLVPKPKARRKRQVRPLAPVTIEKVRFDLLGKGRARDALLVCVLGYAGLRPGEALALRWRHVGKHVLQVEGAVSLGEENGDEDGRRSHRRAAWPPGGRPGTVAGISRGSRTGDADLRSG